MQGIRAFVAVELPARVREEVARTGRALGGPMDRIAWVAPENVHVTLKFLGNVLEKDLAAVTRAIEDATKGGAAFEARVRGLGVFPPGGSPRVLWAGFEEPGTLVEIHGRLDHGLQAFGVGPEGRAYHPHATFGRVHRAEDPRGIRARVEAEAGRDFGAVRVESVTLYQSELGPGGPRYTRLATVPFRG